MKISLLINTRMPNIVGIFKIITWENFMLSWAEHEKSFIISGARLFLQVIYFSYSSQVLYFTNMHLTTWHYHQSSHCSHEETLHAWLSKISPVKILIRLHVGAGWSESLLGTRLKIFAKKHICCWKLDIFSPFKLQTSLGYLCSLVRILVICHIILQYPWLGLHCCYKKCWFSLSRNGKQWRSWYDGS